MGTKSIISTINKEELPIVPLEELIEEAGRGEHNTDDFQPQSFNLTIDAKTIKKNNFGILGMVSW